MKVYLDSVQTSLHQNLWDKSPRVCVSNNLWSIHLVCKSALTTTCQGQTCLRDFYFPSQAMSAGMID